MVRLDLPGYGLTGPVPDHDYTAARHARVVAALLDQLGIARADLAGNSFGGRIALTLALAHPHRVRKLVLVDAAGLRGQQPPVGLGQVAAPPRHVEPGFGRGRSESAVGHRFGQLRRVLDIARADRA